MKDYEIYPAQAGDICFGILQVQVVCDLGSRPVEDAKVQVCHKDEPGTVLAILSTDISGKTIEIELPAPPIEYSMEPSDYQPYSEYSLVITALGLSAVQIDGVQLLPYVKTIQPVRLPFKAGGNDTGKVIRIGPHYLFGNYSPKIYEDEIKDPVEALDPKPVTIPETIIVHDGLPSDVMAPDYNIAYRDYIKNVVSCQIYATWPQETIYANVLSCLSFSLNRIYTGWYPGKGYHFTITSSSAFDQLWINGRNIDSNISLTVDYVFNHFLSMPDIIQPVLTQFCSGRIACEYMMSLWGSKNLGDRNYKAIDILRQYYGDKLYINFTENVDGITIVRPNTVLQNGTVSEEVKYVQNKLRILSHAYTEIPETEADGVFDLDMISAVSAFQRIFHLPVTGTIDAVTWYKISHVHSSLTNASRYSGNN